MPVNRVATLIMYPNIAPDICPDSRGGKGRIAVLFYVALAATQKLGDRKPPVGDRNPSKPP